MRYYVLIFLFTFNSYGMNIEKNINAKIKSLSNSKSFKDHRKIISSALDELKKIKKTNKLSDKDFYLVTDFSKVLESILTMKEKTKEQCFQTRIEVMSNFGSRSPEMKEDDLPLGARKGLDLLKRVCLKDKKASKK